MQHKTTTVFNVIAFLLILTFLSHNSFSQRHFIYKKKRKNIYFEDYIDLNKNGKKDFYEDPEIDVEVRIADLLKQMTLEEKTCQLATLYGYGRVLKDPLPAKGWENEIWKDGIGNIDEHLNSVAYHPEAETKFSEPPALHAKAINETQRFFVEETRLGIPADFTTEGIRGLCHKGATSFPSQIGQGSTWNTDLIYEIGCITALEAKSLGYTNVYSPVLDLARDPRWGRVLSCYGEDPFLVSRMGMEMVEGLQDHGVASTLKHFAVYSIPKGGRDGAAKTDPQCGMRDLHSIHLYPFKKAVTTAHALGVMSSYNDFDGVPVSSSSFLLDSLLRKQWGFQGYVVSDSWAVGGLHGRHFIADDFKDCVEKSIKAGLNVRTNFSPPEDFIFPLRELIDEGKISEQTLNDRVRDVLRVKFLLGLFDKPYVEEFKKANHYVHRDEHASIAKLATLESIVLLKNDGFLPLDRKKKQKILVCGPNAKYINNSIGRYGPSGNEVISVWEGLEEIDKGKVKIDYCKGCDHYDENWPANEIYDIPPSNTQQALIDEAIEKAKENDVIILVLGDNQETVGENKSRTSLNLPGNQKDLVKAMIKTGKTIIAILINGRPLTINTLDLKANAIIEAWLPGEYGGEAIAEVLFGDYNPGGKLSLTFPRTVGQLPFNFPCKPKSQAGQSQKPIGVTRVSGALYPFGHGLSYSDFEYSGLQISEPHDQDHDNYIIVSFNVKNVSNCSGEEVPQLYINDKISSLVTFEKVLRGFKRIRLDKGETSKLTFILSQEDFMFIDASGKMIFEPGEFEIMVGSSSEDTRLSRVIKL
ncbi:MAG: glycoside hydrolase family 3 N-terminal domain-containing protein [Bacteroidales bacterium]